MACKCTSIKLSFKYMEVTLTDDGGKFSFLVERREISHC